MKKWIQKIKLKKGGLHKLLGINAEEKIPRSLIGRIMKAEVGDVIRNPSMKGRRKIKVTRILKKKVNLARNLSKIKRKRG